MRLTASELQQALSERSDYFIVDIREPYEYEACNIGSMHVPMADISKRIDELPKNRTLVIMCRSGKRAEAVANLLISDFGFHNTRYLEGGILAWRDQVDQTLELE
ncbi:MAG: rhodanese-like domain-containing protein [Bacteroidota bacterium]|jgi:rhodanese-related sulfurtransferase